MYRVVNRSTTNLSIGGSNLAPGQGISIEQLSSDLRYLESKRMVSVSPIFDTTPSTIVSKSKLNPGTKEK